jgi:hypothetical protein
MALHIQSAAVGQGQVQSQPASQPATTVGLLCRHRGHGVGSNIAHHTECHCRQCCYLVTSIVAMMAHAGCMHGSQSSPDSPDGSRIAHSEPVYHTRLVLMLTRQLHLKQAEWHSKSGCQSDPDYKAAWLVPRLGRHSRHSVEMINELVHGRATCRSGQGPACMARHGPAGGTYVEYALLSKPSLQDSAGTQPQFLPALSLQGIASADLLPRRGQSSRPRHRCPPPPRPQVRALKTGRAQRRVPPLQQLAAAAGTSRHWKRGTLQGEAASS